MIRKGGTKDMVARYKLQPNGKWWVVQEVRKGARLIWQAIRSCFGSGYWINGKPWLNEEPWKNN